MADLDYGPIQGVDDGELRNLIQHVHDGNLDDTKRELTRFLGSSMTVYTKSALVRAKVYSKLIAVALGLTPADIRFRKKDEIKGPTNRNSKKTEKKEEWVDYDQLCEKWTNDGPQIMLRYLLEEILEEDDNVMTVIFGISSEDFRRHPVEYFVGCTPDVYEQIQDLWLTEDVLKEFYFEKLYIGPIVFSLSSTKDRNIEAKLKLCEHLQKRSRTAGARLFWLVAKHRKSDIVGELVKDIMNIDTDSDSSFKDEFLWLWDIVPSSLSILNFNIADLEHDGHGQSICVGPASDPRDTDHNLLCWAARRNYHDLIWCVMQVYKPPSKLDSGYDYWEEYGVSFVWRYALWCATRHGDLWEVIRELSAPEWTKGIDFNDYPSGWLPPLHLAALYGDARIMDTLCAYLKVESCADKKDYLGRTPLDYAMQFKTTETIRYPFSKKGDLEDYKTRGHKDVVKKLLHMKGVGERLKELYDMYIHQANTVLIGAALIASVTFAGWLQPPLSYGEYFQFTRPNPSSKDVHYQSYIAIEGHRSIEVFVVFNTLSFFSAIATMFFGAEATLYAHDNDERTSALIRMRKTIKWMIGFFIASMTFFMTAFISAGIAILPPILSLECSMIVSLVVGGGICITPLTWILWSIFGRRVLFFINEKSQKSNSSWEIRRNSESLISIEQLDEMKQQLNQVLEQPSSAAENQGIQGSIAGMGETSQGETSTEEVENNTATSKEQEKIVATSEEDEKSTQSTVTSVKEEKNTTVPDDNN